MSKLLHTSSKILPLIGTLPDKSTQGLVSIYSHQPTRCCYSTFCNDTFASKSMPQLIANTALFYFDCADFFSIFHRRCQRAHMFTISQYWHSLALPVSLISFADVISFMPITNANIYWQYYFTTMIFPQVGAILMPASSLIFLYLASFARWHTFMRILSAIQTWHVQFILSLLFHASLLRLSASKRTWTFFMTQMRLSLNFVVSGRLPDLPDRLRHRAISRVMYYIRVRRWRYLFAQLQ